MKSTSLSPKSSTPNTRFPLHKLTANLTKLWLVSKAARSQMADKLAKEYGEGVGILGGTMRLIAFVHSNGGVEELPPPHRAYEIHQIANQPRPEECFCSNFYTPEVNGPWRNTGSREHHPICEFERDSKRIDQEHRRSGESLLSIRERLRK